MADAGSVHSGCIESDPLTPKLILCSTGCPREVPLRGRLSRAGSLGLTRGLGTSAGTYGASGDEMPLVL